MASKITFFILGLVAVAKAQQGYPRDAPLEQLGYNAAGQRYTQDEESSGGEIPGEAGKDYPTFGEIPETRFDCGQQQFPGYYADTEARCQVFHICQRGGRHDGFLCPNGTVFNQEKLVCDWWYNFDCAQAESFYSVNEAIVRAMEEADRLAAEQKAAEGYRYNSPSGSRNQQQGRPLSGGSPQSDFDTVVVEAARGAPRQFSKPQRAYGVPELAGRQQAGNPAEDSRKNSKITGATFGQQISAVRDAEVLQEPGQQYLPAEIQAGQY